MSDDLKTFSVYMKNTLHLCDERLVCLGVLECRIVLLIKPADGTVSRHRLAPVPERTPSSLASTEINGIFEMGDLTVFNRTPRAWGHIDSEKLTC